MKSLRLLLLLCISGIQAYGQVDSTSLQKIEAPNILVSPTLSLVLIDDQHWELNFFNSFQSREITFTESQFDVIAFRFDTVSSSVQFSSLEHLLQLQYGVSQNNRLNIGLDFYFSHARIDADAGRSPFRLFGGEDEDSENFRSFSGIGPRVRWIPFESFPEFSIQNSFVFPIAEGENKRAAFGRDRVQFLTQLVTYQRFGGSFQALGELDFALFFANDTRQLTTLNIPLYLSVSAQLPGYNYPRYFTFASLSLSQSFDTEKDESAWESNQFFSQAGLGISCQFSPRASIFLLGQATIAESQNRLYIVPEQRNNLLAEFISVEQSDWFAINLGFKYNISP